MKKYSIKDIARLSGVSVATVSRVINNNGRFSDETKQKVLKVIQETGYQMNYSAKSLRMNRSYTVGIIVPDITNYFFAKVIESIEGELFAKGYSTIICNSARDAKKEESYLQMLEGKGVDGLIIIAGSEKFSFHSHADKPIPYICIDREPDNLSETIFISSDHLAGGQIAGNYLFSRGCNHPIVVTHSHNSKPSNDRVLGFMASFKQHSQPFKVRQNQYDYDFNDRDTEHVFIDFLKNNPSIDGIFCVNDTLALEIQNHIKHSGLDAKSYTIVGFDNIPAIKYTSPCIVTINQDIPKLAKLSVDKLLHLLDHSNELGKTFKIAVELTQ